jgi:hypothetical protein
MANETNEHRYFPRFYLIFNWSNYRSCTYYICILSNTFWRHIMKKQQFKIGKYKGVNIFGVDYTWKQFALMLLVFVLSITVAVVI